MERMSRSSTDLQAKSFSGGPSRPAERGSWVGYGQVAGRRAEAPGSDRAEAPAHRRERVAPGPERRGRRGHRVAQRAQLCVYTITPSVL